MEQPRNGALHRRSGTVLTRDVAQTIRSEPQECAQEHETENGGRKAGIETQRTPAGCTAETVIEGLENFDDYPGFEAAIIAD
jgi:hypothetical protein